MREAKDNRGLAATLRWAALVVVAALVVGLTACGSPIDELAPDTQSPSLSLSGVTDGQIVGTSDVTVTAVATDDRGVESVLYSLNGGARVTCASFAGDAWSCGPISLSLGDNTIVVTAYDQAGNAVSRTVRVRYEPSSSASSFDIDLRFLDASFDAAQQARFYAAAQRWEEIITADVEDTYVSSPAGQTCLIGEPELDETVDDLVIFVRAMTTSDGEYGVLGGAAPCWFRNAGPDTGTTVVAYMEFDLADVELLLAEGDLEATITHEMGHALGIGVYWEFEPYFEPLIEFDAIDGTECHNASAYRVLPHYVGAGGLTAWADLGGTGPLPVEDEGGFGTQCAHWNEETFGPELMTGSLNARTANPLSELTIRALGDLGYAVDVFMKDPYTLPVGSVSTQDSIDLAGRERLRRPVAGIDPSTGRVTPVAR